MMLSMLLFLRAAIRRVTLMPMPLPPRQLMR